MLLYSAFIYFFFASVVRADRSSTQGQPQLFKRSEAPQAVAGATLAAPKSSILSMVGSFRVPVIPGDLQATSSTALGVMFDGLDGCPGMFAGVQIIVGGGEAYFNAVYRNSTSVDYDVYEKSGVSPGDLVTINISASDNRKSISAKFNNGPESRQTTINFDTPLCLSHASWVVEALPKLNLTKNVTVNVTATVNSVDHGWSFNPQQATPLYSWVAGATLLNNIVSIIVY